MNKRGTLDVVGNWNGYKLDANGDGDYTDANDLDQSRTHNLVNEITGVSEGQGQSQWATPGWDSRGNMTTVPKPSDLPNSYTATYDSWNRLVEVKSGATTIQKNEYDGLNRRVKVHMDTGGDPGIDTYRYFFCNTSWQIVETRKTTTENDEPETLQPEYQYVWSTRYIDSPVLRDKNTDEDSLCDDQRLYYLTDANFNVTCLVDTGGDALERYIYDAYGTPTVLDADWSVDADGKSDYDNNILFAGYYYDWETGLYHVRNRMYHPPLGRWLQRDPARYVDGMSLYQSFRDNPACLVDPTGQVIIYPSVPREEWLSPIYYRSAAELDALDALEFKLLESRSRLILTQYYVPMRLPAHQNVKECKNRQANGVKPIPNGCGPAGGPRIPQVGPVDFTPACNSHDICYGTCNSDRKECDVMLWVDMSQMCDNYLNSLSSWRRLVYGNHHWLQCQALAGVYLAAVRGFGEDAYWTAQNEVCECKCK